MKTIDLLIQALPAIGGWPEKVTHIGQDYDRELMFYGRGNVRSGIILDQLAVDHRKHGDVGMKITREQYEGALAAKNDDWIDFAGGECPVQEGVLVEVKYRNEKNYHINGINRAGRWSWEHYGTDGDIIAYRLHKPQEAEQAKADDEADLNECIGQDAAPVWNGEGLPPVGCECEVSVDGGRSWCTYRAINEKNGARLIEIGNFTEEFQNNNWIFRQIRTEAERKREEAVKTIMLTGWCQSAAEEIYDLVAAGKVPGMKLED